MYLRAPFGVNIIRWRYAYFLSCIVPIDLSTYYGTNLAAPALKTVGPPKDFRLELDCDFDPCAASSDRIFMCPTLPSGTDTTDPWVQ